MHNILICSANEDLLMTLRAASDGGDVRLTVCHRGMDAVRALMALSFDRLILDLETPGLDGPFLVSITRRIDPHLPVVAVSRGPVVQAREIQHKGVAHHLVPLPASPEIAQRIALGVEPVAAGVQQIG
jgi:DNA-binding response OmpR family regulator